MRLSTPKTTQKLSQRKIRRYIAIFVFSVFLIPTEALATTQAYCDYETRAGHYAFKGKLLNRPESAFNKILTHIVRKVTLKFEVHRVYKGDIKLNSVFKAHIPIKHINKTTFPPNHFRKGDEYIFATNKKHFAAPCLWKINFSKISLNEERLESLHGTLLYLEHLRAREFAQSPEEENTLIINGLKKLTEDYGEILPYTSALAKKLRQHAQYDNAKYYYERALEQKYQEGVQHAHYLISSSRLHKLPEALRFEECSGPYGPTASTPFFLKTLPPPLPSGYYHLNDRDNLLLEYIETLIYSGDYTTAYRALCIAEGTERGQGKSTDKILDSLHKLLRQETKTPD
jgi:hypothetical protein